MDKQLLRDALGWGFLLWLIGFILGGMMENNFARAVNIADGVSFMWERPGTLILLLIGIGLIILPAWRRRRAFARERALARRRGVADGS